MLKIKNIKPLFTSIVTTADKYEESETLGSGLIYDTRKSEGALKEYQRVVAIGSAVRETKVGDLVLINPTRYMKKDKMTSDSLREEFMEPTYSIEFPIVELDDKQHLMIQESDVAYIITDYEDVKVTEPAASIILPESKLIL